MKKILLIVWNNDALSKYLLRRSIFNKSVNIDIQDIDKIYQYVTSLNQDMERYCTKMIILSDPDDLKCLFTQVIRSTKSNNFQVSNPLFICLLDKTENLIPQFIKDVDRKILNTYGQVLKITDVIDILDHSDQEDMYLRSLKTKIQYTDILKSFTVIDDLIIEMQIDGYKFHSNRDISRLRRIRYKSLHLTVVIDDVTEKSLTNKIFENIFINIKNQLDAVNPIENDYLIGNVDYRILVTDHVSATKIKEVDSYINALNKRVGNNTIKSTIHLYNFTDEDLNLVADANISLKNKHVDNLPKIAQCIRSLYGLYKFQELCDLNKLTTDYVMIYRCIESVSNDSNRFDQIVLSSEIDRATKQNLNQYIAVHKNNFILGTKKIIGFLMLLYQYYGYYKPWLNVRRFQTNGILSSTDYYKYDKFRYMDCNVQMIEHIMHFTDVMMTTIQKVQVPDLPKQTVIIIGAQIPGSLDSSMMNDDRYNIHCIRTDANTNINQNTDSNECVIMSYRRLAKDNNIVCVLMWKFLPNIDLLSDIDSSVKIFYLQYHSDPGTIVTENIENKFMRAHAILIIEETRFCSNDETAKYTEFVQDNDHSDRIKSFPLHHQYIDTTIGTGYTEKGDILTDLTIFVSEISDNLYKTTISTINESDINNCGVIKIVNYNRSETMFHNNNAIESLLCSVKQSRIIVTDDPYLCMMAMCYRTLVIMMTQNQESSTLTNNMVPCMAPYVIKLEIPEKVVKQIKVMLKQSNMNIMGPMLDEGYCVASKLTWRRFLTRNILDHINTDV